jgi:hypothetical protein
MPLSILVLYIFFFLKKKFPGIVDKRDRLQLIDYDHLSMINNTDTNPKVLKRSRSVVNKKKKKFFEIKKYLII